MTLKGPGLRTRHVVAISVSGMLLGFAAAIVLLLVSAARSDGPADAGRTSVMGTIGRTGLGPGHDVAEVGWQDDRTMTPRTVRFRFFYPDDWHEGETFGISYDPGDPSGPVFAAPGYRGYADDGSPQPWWVFPLLATPGIVLCAVFWLSRGWLNLRARRAVDPG